MSAILHVTQAGHRCNNPLKDVTAGRIQLGSQLRLGEWELFWAVRGRCYVVCRRDLRGDHYEFTNFNCACAKLAELGK